MTCPDCAALRWYRATARASPSTLVYALDHDLRCVLVEGAAELAMLRMRRSDLLGKHLAAFSSPDNITTATTCARLALRGYVSAVTLERGDRTFAVQYAPARDDDGAIIGCAVIARDVTDLVQREREAAAVVEARLLAEAETDALTGLPNRRAFERIAAVLVADALAKRSTRPPPPSR